MNPSISRPRALLAAAAVAFACASAAGAAGAPYVLDSDGQPMRSGSAACWRTGYWTPAAAEAAYAGGKPMACICEPDLLRAGACAAGDAPSARSAAPPVPEPSPAAPPPIKDMAGPVKVKLSAEARFRFNTSLLETESRARLDELARQLEGIELEVLLAVGHADRIGGERYNQEISEKRAAEVKAYLIGKGVAADRIYTEGKGEKQPAHLGDCEDLGAESGSNEALVDCLAADRRVEIEVIGVR